MNKKGNYQSNKEDYGIYCTEIASLTESPAHQLSEHAHERVEIIYALDVNADIMIGGTPFRFQSGDIAVITPRTPHFEHISGNGRYFSIKFPPDLLFSTRRGFSEYISFGNFILQNSEKLFFERNDIASTEIHNIVREIMQEWDTKSNGYEQIIRAAIIKLLTLLSRIQNHRNMHTSVSQNDAISHALTYISNNCSTATEKSAAESCGLSLSYFSTLFKSSVGIKFNDYLLKTKLDRAKALLISTDNSMTYIAFETGFSSSSHFISRFREYEGTTPLKYRNDVRSGKKKYSIRTPQFIVRFENVGQPSGQYLIFKYRTNRLGSPLWIPFFVETNAGYATNNGLTWAIINGDEKWHVIIIDMSETKQLTDAFSPGSDGNYYAGYVRIHPFYRSFLPTFYFDIEYAAFADSIEQSLGIVGDGEDIFHGYFSNVGTDQWIKKELDANIVPSSKESLFYSSKEKLLSSIVSSGISLRKIELLSENGKEFTRVWCM